MKVYFIGAGPGDPDLLTIKALKAIRGADIIIYAGSLINKEILKFARKGSRLYDSSAMSLEEVLQVIKDAKSSGRTVARIHSGDPSIYGAIQEQMDWCEREGIDYRVVPGVSSFQAAAASLKQELTLPGVSQTVILTRISGKTKVPAKEDLRRLAWSRATMVIFLSVQEMDRVVRKLKGSYGPDTPVAVLEKVSFPDERKITGTLRDIAKKVKESGIRRQALIIVGDVLNKSYRKSKLYDGEFEHMFRKAKGIGQRAKSKYSKPLALSPKPTAILILREKDRPLALRIKSGLPESRIYIAKGRLKKLTKRLFSEVDGIVFCMAVGIVVRAIASSVKNKLADPAVVAVDGQGRFAVSLLSGHEGGANALAIRVANALGAEPVITTASEAKREIVIGLGCKRGIGKEEIVRAVRYALVKTGRPIEAVRCIATIDLKQDEPGLVAAAAELGLPLRAISSDLVSKFTGRYQRSSFVKAKIGVEGVSEPCALIAAKRPRLILSKRKIGPVTVAAVKEV